MVSAGFRVKADASRIPDFDERKHRPVPGGELLWSVRAWVVGTCCQMPAEARIREALAPVAAPEAADRLFDFLQAVALGTARKLSIACMCDAQVSPDERLLLSIVGLCQHGRRLEAMILLRMILPPQAAMAACGSAESLAAILAGSDCWLAAPRLPSIQHAGFVANVSGALPAGMH